MKSRPLSSGDGAGLHSSIPNVGYIEFEDAETGERLIMDTRDPQVREDFAATVREEDADRHEDVGSGKREKLFKSISVDSIDISTDRPYVQSLIHFFRLSKRSGPADAARGVLFAGTTHQTGSRLPSR